MKMYISYFYQIRFFKPNMVPISTATWDPKWYKDGGVHRDNNGVINGYRMPILNFPSKWWEQLQKNDSECKKGCQMTLPCPFMKLYKQYLDSLDFEDIIIKPLNELSQYLKVEDPVFVFIVHEPATCKCAERPVLQQWFKEHDIDLLEWEKSK